MSGFNVLHQFKNINYYYLIVYCTLYSVQSTFLQDTSRKYIINIFFNWLLYVNRHICERVQIEKKKSVKSNSLKRRLLHTFCLYHRKLWLIPCFLFDFAPSRTVHAYISCVCHFIFSIYYLRRFRVHYSIMVPRNNYKKLQTVYSIPSEKGDFLLSKIFTFFLDKNKFFEPRIFSILFSRHNDNTFCVYWVGSENAY